MVFNGLNAIMRKGDSDTLEVRGLSLLVGDRLYLTVKDHPYTTNKKLSKVVTEFEPNGDAFILLNPEDTKNLHPKEYVYDIQVTFSDNSVLTIVPPDPKMPLPKFILTEEVTYE